MSTPNDQQPRNPEDDDRTISDEGSSPAADSEQTIADGAADQDTARGGSPSQSDNDQTLLDASSETDRSSVAEGNDEQTIVADAGTAEETIADANLASGDENSDGQTIGNQTQALPGASPTSDDQTITDEAQPESADATIADEASTPTSDATIADSPTDGHDDATQLDAGQPADPDQTLPDSVASGDPNATLADGGGGADEFNHTVAEGDFTSDATSIEGPSANDDIDATIVSKDGSDSAAPSQQRPSQPPPRRKHPGAHETADRWETQQRYQLVSNFARGGLGQIWMARDARLRREVAFKELLPSALKNKNALERFLEEAQITGQLEHPSIVPIYDIGYQQNGTPFYAMKLVRGETMEKHIEALHELPKDSPEFSLTFRKLLRKFIDICNALAFAHDRGVLHRDLKPLNVMLGAFGETLVLDWGLAKVLDVPVTDEDAAPITTDHGGSFSVDDKTVIQSSDDSSQTGATQGATAQLATSQAGATQGATTSGASMGGQSQQMSGTFGVTRRMVVTDVRSVGSQTMDGSVMGTPAYMPPEQGRGDLDELDARSDIYSLGGILYKLLTNQQPIARGKIREVLKNVVEGNIIPPREHDATTPKPLEAIALKALAKNKDDRYASALDLAHDIEAWLADEAVSCFEDFWTVKARRWAKRHRTAVGSGTAAVVGITLMYGMWSWSHAARIGQIREFALAKISQAKVAAGSSDYTMATSLLSDTIVRVAAEPDLEDLHTSLQSELALVQSERVRRLERKAESNLAEARSAAAEGRYNDSRTSLTALQVELEDEPRLRELLIVVRLDLQRVESAIEREAAVDEAETRFRQFLELCDEARARGSLQTMDNVDDDAKLAQQHATEALELFGLNSEEPFATTPAHFGEELPWTRRHNDRTGRWPIDELKNNSLELLLILGDMEVQLARNAEDEQQEAAAARALDFVDRGKTIGIESVALLGNESLWLKMAGREDEAREVLTRAAKLKPSTSLDFYLLAEGERKSNNYQKALELYQKAQQLSPTSYWPQHFTGLCHLQLGEAQAALACFTNCISLRENYAWPRMLRGLCNAQLQCRSRGRLRHCRGLDGNLYNIPINRGVVLTVASRFEDALTQFERAAELGPNTAQPHINIATAHFEIARQTSDAMSPYDQLPELDRLQKAQEHYGLALDALAIAAQTNRAPDHPGIHQLRGRIEERAGNTQGALSSYQKHLTVEPNGVRRAFTLHRIGLIHFQLGNYNEALAAYEQAHQLTPNDGRIVRDLAETHLQLRNATEAGQRFDEYIKLVNADIEEHLEFPDIVFNGMATAKNLQRKKREANDFYTLSLMFNPDQAGVLTQRGWLLLTENLQLAKADFEASASQNNGDPHTLTGLALTQTKLGDWQAALQTMKPAMPAIEEQAEAVGPQGFALYHNAATVYAQILVLMERDERLTDEQRKTNSPLLFAQVVALLRNAKEVASQSPPYLNAMQQALKAEPEFAPLRGRPEFIALQRELLGEAAR